MLSADLSTEVLERINNPIFILDNDETGRKKSLDYIKRGYRVFIWPDNIFEKDMNELLKRISKNEIKELILNNIFSGLEAELKIKMKR